MISQDDTFSFRKEKAIKSHFYTNAHELGRMSSEIRSLIRNRCKIQKSVKFSHEFAERSSVTEMCKMRGIEYKKFLESYKGEEVF